MFDATKFDRVDPGTGTVNSDGSEYVIELAEMQYAGALSQSANRMVAPPRNFVLENCPQLGMHRSFHFVNHDESGGDIAGWRYEEDNGPNKGNDSYRNPGSVKAVSPFTILIIND